MLILALAVRHSSADSPVYFLQSFVARTFSISKRVLCHYGFQKEISSAVTLNTGSLYPTISCNTSGLFIYFILVSLQSHGASQHSGTMTLKNNIYLQPPV